MSNNNARPDIVNYLQDPLSGEVLTSSFIDDSRVVVPLFPLSFINDSILFNRDITHEYTGLHQREENRRRSFLDDCVYLDYAEEPLIDVDQQAEQKSEKAWEGKFVFTDGSYLTGSDFRFIDDLPSASDTNEIGLYDVGVEDYQAFLRIKYEQEAKKYKEELIQIAGKERNLNPVPVVIKTDDNLHQDLVPEVLDELDELFKLSDERESIVAVELVRIAKEEKQAKIQAIFTFFEEGLKED